MASATLDAQPYLSPSQAGRRLGVSSERVRQLTREGRLPYVPSPLGRLLPREAVEALAQERTAARAAATEEAR